MFHLAITHHENLPRVTFPNPLFLPRVSPLKKWRKAWFISSLKALRVPRWQGPRVPKMWKKPYRLDKRRHQDFKEFDSVRGRRVMPFDEVGMFCAKHLKLFRKKNNSFWRTNTVLGNRGVMWFHENSFFEMIVGELFILFFKSGFGWGKNLEICGVEFKSVLWTSMTKCASSDCNGTCRSCVALVLEQSWILFKNFHAGWFVHVYTFKVCETPHSKWLWSPDDRSYHRIFVWMIMGKSPRGKRSDQIWVHARQKPAV